MTREQKYLISDACRFGLAGLFLKWPASRAGKTFMTGPPRGAA